MGTFTAKITGLECSFHCTVRLKFVGHQTVAETVKSEAGYCEKAQRVNLLEGITTGKNICPRVWITFSGKGRLAVLFTSLHWTPILVWLNLTINALRDLNLLLLGNHFVSVATMS